MSFPLTKLSHLRDEMVTRGWGLTCFSYAYKRHHYFVLVGRYVPPRQAPLRALVELTFIDRQDVARCLVSPANSLRLMIDAKKLRRFFGIEWKKNLGDILQQFAEELGKAIPSRLPEQYTADERRVLLRALSSGDAEDPDKVFCTSVRRNPPRADGSSGQRSVFNAQKTQLLRPTLFARLGGDPNLSFCYSRDSADERSDDAIYELLSQRQG